ncbi:Hypothetical protein R9X50_00494400 [Acrodontium crateriforme]|uniref:Uncharacterized protein n=1 Tax=Acrodontium crateriforme TaxID=150365 RepID=A0AAQ3M5I7_9PEZI|nr:Hypothetical protein R9X50_00494400 [Acrodontium crateriforme]
MVYTKRSNTQTHKTCTNLENTENHIVVAAIHVEFYQAHAQSNRLQNHSRHLAIKTMCNGESGRLSQGGTIAVLRAPRTTIVRPSLERELSLRFRQDSSNVTHASFDGLNADSTGSQVIIHRDGDLITGAMTDDSILHSIAVPRSATSGETTSFALSEPLNLSAGADGVIGRRISFVSGRTVIGQGIIGWN